MFRQKERNTNDHFRNEIKARWILKDLKDNRKYEQYYTDYFNNVNEMIIFPMVLLSVLKNILIFRIYRQKYVKHSSLSNSLGQF